MHKSVVPLVVLVAIGAMTGIAVGNAYSSPARYSETQNPVQIDTKIQNPKSEDDPTWDCRVDGNKTCGVVVQDVRYILVFQDGAPASFFVAPVQPTQK